MPRISSLICYGAACLSLFLVGMDGQLISEVFADKSGNGYVPYVNPYSLHIAIMITIASVILSKIYFHKPNVRTSPTLPSGANTDKQMQLAKYDRQVMLYYWVRPITYNITVLTAYLACMSVIVEPGLNLLVGVMSFYIPILEIPAYMADSWYMIFLQDGYLSQTSQHVTHPNLYLFYGIFILPFMIGATKILHSDVDLTKRTWFKKIIKYILKIFVLLIIIAVIFIFSQLPQKSWFF